MEIESAGGELPTRDCLAVDLVMLKKKNHIKNLQKSIWISGRKGQSSRKTRRKLQLLDNLINAKTFQFEPRI